MTFLDTNLLVYFIDRRDSRKWRIAREIVSAAIGSPNYKISVQVLNEFANVALKKLSMTEDDVRGCVEDFMRIEVAVQNSGQTCRALEIRKRYGVQFFDALLLAAAEANGCEEILTEDLNDGQTYCGVRAVNPFAA